MQRTLFVLCLILFSYWKMGIAQDLSSLSNPTPYVQGVNVITGRPDEKDASASQYEFYQEGWNQIELDTLFLPKGDFRINKVKTVHAYGNIHFSYEPGVTWVLDTPERKSVYRYTNTHLIQSVEHYYKESSKSFKLYRCERLFWQEAQPSARLISRTLEDEKGEIVLCMSFDYNPQGQLIKETFHGNLSGNCQISCKMGADGYPQLNGVESYGKTLIYSEETPELLLSEIEDNGLITSYQYDSPTQQCTAKLKGYSGGLLSRCFYLYDQEGFLEQTILDDGQGQHFNDLTGVTQRQMIRSQMSHQPSLIGQPLKIENCYWDVATQQEKGLESVSYVYSEQGQLIQQNFYDADGTLRYNIRFEYDEKGNLISTIDSRGEVEVKKEQPFQERYNAWGQRVAISDAYGNETTYAYDVFGRLISTQSPAVLDLWDRPYHLVTIQTYNICDQVIQVKDPTGETTTISYTMRGHPTKMVYSDGSSEIFTYFLDGALKEKKMRDGTSILLTRDEACRVIRSEKRSASGHLLQTLCYTYQGELTQTVTDEHTFTTRSLYDGAGRQIGTLQETEAGVRRLEWTYDVCGQKAQIKEWFGPSTEDFVMKSEEKDQWQCPQATTFAEASGEQTFKIDHDKSPSSPFVFTQTSSTLNHLGQHVKQEERVDRAGIKQLLTYDALQRLENITQSNSMGVKIAETYFRYDAQGNKVLERHQVLVEGQPVRTFTIRWTYDHSKRLLSIAEEGERDQIKTTRYHYHPNGQLDQITKPDGTLLLYSYNAQEELTRFEASDHSFAYQYVYDDLHQLVAIRDLCHDLVQTRHYNAFHELIEEKQGVDLHVQYHYDLAGRRTGLTLPDDSSIRYHYQGPLLSAVERIGNTGQSLYQQTYGYDGNGRLQTCQLLGELGAVHYQYDAQDRLIALESSWWSQKIGEEGLDAQGRLLAMKIQDKRGEHSSAFTYTDTGQLATEEGHHYTYDSLFNRLSDNGQNWKVNGLNQLVQTPAVSYIYDVNGNLIEKQGKEEKVLYTYDALDRLVRIEYPHQQAFTYVYDTFHRRIRQEVWLWQEEQKNWQLHSSEHLLYDGFKEIGKVNEQGQIVELRILGQGRGAEIGAAVALELKEKLFVPLYDSLGSVRCLVDAETANVVESYDYSAYGEETLWDGEGQVLNHSVVGNPWRFCSKRVDERTGLVFFGKRDYDPVLGRWLTPDPLFFYDTANLYAFNKNDPLNRRDLYGLFSIQDIWDGMVEAFFSCFHYIQASAHQFKTKLSAELRLPLSVGQGIEKVGKELFGSMYFLMGSQFEETYIDSYGEREINDKVRVTFINGILNNRQTLLQSLEIISESHGGVKIHYVYRPTGGWTWDVASGVMIRTAFAFGFRSMHAHLLAKLWRALIQEMGGLEGGGTILHYAHSLGGTETDRARELLTPQEQEMIRVITFGSATLIRNVGFQSVINIAGVNDGVCSFILEPLGNIRNLFDPDSNVRHYGSFCGASYLPFTDHLLNGPTYAPVILQLGEQFLAEFSPF